MKHCIRTVSLILAALLMLLPIACAKSDTSAKDNTTKKGDETTATAETKASQYEDIFRERDDSLPADLDFGGEKINILCLNDDIYKDEIATDELNSDPLNDAIYTRNLDVSERLNVEIVTENSGGSDADISNELIKAVNSGDDTYQIFGDGASPLLQKAMDGYFCNLYDLEKSYMEFDAPWYSQDYLENICSDTKAYCITGALSLSMFRSVHVIYFNKKLATDLNLPDMYDVVNSGKWTVDYETELTGGLYRDLNGNSVADNEDFYGFRTSITWGSDGYWVAFDINFMSRDNDGKFFFDLDTERLTNSLVKLNKLIWESPGSCSVDHGDESNTEAFASGRSFMIMANIKFAEEEKFRNMEDEYGIIPIPKYDESQKEYYSNPSEVYQMYAIPVTAGDPDMVSAVLEAMFAESWRKVVPIYSDIALKGKYMNDLESRKMFDLIIDSMRFEPALHYNYALMEIPDCLLSYPIVDQKSDISSLLAKYNRVIGMLLDELNKSLE